MKSSSSKPSNEYALKPRQISCRRRHQKFGFMFVDLWEPLEFLKNVGWWFQVVPVGYHVDGFRCQLFINFKAHLKEAMVAYSESVGCFKCSHLRDQLFLETWHGDEANWLLASPDLSVILGTHVGCIQVSYRSSTWKLCCWRLYWGAP